MSSRNGRDERDERDGGGENARRGNDRANPSLDVGPRTDPSLARCSRTQQVSKVHGTFDSKAPVPAPRPRDRSRLQDGSALPVHGGARAAGSVRGLPRRPLRGHELVRHSRQASDHHAEGHPTRSTHPRRARVSTMYFFHARVGTVTPLQTNRDPETTPDDVHTDCRLCNTNTHLHHISSRRRRKQIYK